MAVTTTIFSLLPGLFGLNFLFWLLVSAARFITEQVPAYFGRPYAARSKAATHVERLMPRDVAVIMAAHNEELALPATLKALKKNLPAANIYIGSDASTDKTVAIARRHKCNVADIDLHQGKAAVLTYLLEHYPILREYRAVLVMDAEVIISDDYLQKILPYFDDPNVVAFVSHSISHWRQHWLPRWSAFFTAYRIRLWLFLYYGLRYGQTWKFANVTPIIPGGSSVYRTSALSQLEIDTPGLIIEDFHMTFQVHHKKLGRIASHPSAAILDQEPYSFRDYTRQVYRWFLGFWQTYFLHGYWPSKFWFATTLFLLEMTLSSIIVLTIPFLLAAMLFTPLDSFAVTHISLTSLNIERAPVTVSGLIISYFILDYVMTMLTAWIEGKPAIFFYGIGFFLLRYVDTAIFLYTLPLSLLMKNTAGTWRSPARRNV